MVAAESRMERAVSGERDGLRLAGGMGRDSPQPILAEVFRAEDDHAAIGAPGEAANCIARKLAEILW